jgi:hypothetical protein
MTYGGLPRSTWSWRFFGHVHATHSSLHQVRVNKYITSTFFNIAESHIGSTTFGDEPDRIMTRLDESLAENILSMLQQVFLPKHSGSGKVKNSDDTSEAIRSSHTFDSHNMNRNLFS